MSPNKAKFSLLLSYAYFNYIVKPTQLARISVFSSLYIYIYPISSYSSLIAAQEHIQTDSIFLLIIHYLLLLLLQIFNLLLIIDLQMGNYISCTLSTQSLKNSKSGTKVIFPTGEIRRLHEPTKAAELMFENPNYFLVNSRSLQIGRRFSALNADEDLEMGHVYVMFLMKRLNSVVTAADMGALFIMASSATKRASGGKLRILPESSAPARVSPESEVVESTDQQKPRLSLDDIEDVSVLEFQHRTSMCRSRRPMLETIVEEPVFSR